MSHTCIRRLECTTGDWLAAVLRTVSECDFHVTLLTFIVWILKMEYCIYFSCLFLISSKSASHSSTLLVQCITAFGLCFFNYPAFFQRSLQVRRGSPKVSHCSFGNCWCEIFLQAGCPSCHLPDSFSNTIEHHKNNLLCVNLAELGHSRITLKRCSVTSCAVFVNIIMFIG